MSIKTGGRSALVSPSVNRAHSVRADIGD